MKGTISNLKNAIKKSRICPNQSPRPIAQLPLAPPRARRRHACRRCASGRWRRRRPNGHGCRRRGGRRRRCRGSGRRQLRIHILQRHLGKAQRNVVLIGKQPKTPPHPRHARRHVVRTPFQPDPLVLPALAGQPSRRRCAEYPPALPAVASSAVGLGSPVRSAKRPRSRVGRRRSGYRPGLAAAEEAVHGVVGTSVQAGLDVLEEMLPLGSLDASLLRRRVVPGEREGRHGRCSLKDGFREGGGGRRRG